MSTTKKTPSLAAFTRKAAQPASPAPVPATEAPVVATKTTPGAPRRRAQGPVVNLSLRIARDDWQRLHMLALTEGVSINTLALRGLSLIFESKGLPGVMRE